MSDLQRTFTEIIERTGAKTSTGSWQYQGHCPAHDDRSPSLSISLKEDRILLCCHAGCSFDSICKSLELTSVALFDSKSRQMNGAQINQEKNH